ncbi:MAG: glycogen synthase, partial [Synergistaceae bacterium]|nr:glycogen synthase [Synergistaceae bacterium]
MGRLYNGHKALHVTVEMAPLAKQGGLGDVLGALPKALRKNGVDARVLLPLFPGVMESAQRRGGCRLLPDRVNIAIDWRVYSGSIYEVDLDGLTVYLLDQPELFTNPRIYPTVLTQSSLLPFVFLSLAALELPGSTGWQPDIIHVHDWSTAIVPIALRWHRHYRALRPNYDVVLTIHNLAHQGIVDSSFLNSWGLTRDSFSLDGLEFYGQANIIKGGVLSSDVITTVSPHYSWDIQTIDGGFGLHGVFSSLRGKLHGILNGIDYDIWNPKTDPLIPANYSPGDISGKAACRRKLLEVCGWEDDGRPIIAFVGRLVQQKGVDILFTALEWMLAESCRAVVIGSGQQQYEDWARQFRERYPEHFWCLTDFDEDLSHLVYAGSDILAMPSLFEPCGLSQMIAMAYGTVPVVRGTGGLADTVIDFDSSDDGTGYIFSDYSTDEFHRAASRATGAYQDKSRWNAVIKNGMNADFSWDAATTAYID